MLVDTAGGAGKLKVERSRQRHDGQADLRLLGTGRVKRSRRRAEASDRRHRAARHGLADLKPTTSSATSSRRINASTPASRPARLTMARGSGSSLTVDETGAASELLVDATQYGGFASKKSARPRDALLEFGGVERRRRADRSFAGRTRSKTIVRWRRADGHRRPRTRTVTVEVDNSSIRPGRRRCRSLSMRTIRSARISTR